MANFNKADLEFILQQINIANAHPDGDVPIGTGQNQVSSPLLPFGLRTVTGEYNNLIPGQKDFGAADTQFPHLVTPPNLRNAEALPFDPDGPGPLNIGDQTSYTQLNGLVVDSQPRIISNLIVDQTSDNPAAVAASGITTGTPGDGVTLPIPNVAQDEGLSAPFNSWFTLFGQFFDHGLDLVSKGNSGTVFMPLQPDDPLYIVGSPTNFMVLSRATNLPGDDGIVGTSDDIREHTNTTTPFVDQNQTYTSHPSHQVFLRDYEMVNGKPVSSGKLLEHTAGGGSANWADIKAQALAKLGIILTDQDIFNVPLLATDAYGKFLNGPNGFPQIVTTTGLVEGAPGGIAIPSNAHFTEHAFLVDIAHHAVSFGDHDNDPATAPQALTPDTDPGFTDDGDPTTYDDEMLNAHFINGDGRSNENIGLTTVHHVFHSEHNRLVEQTKDVILSSNDPAFEAQWKLSNGDWDGQKLFQAAKFGTEMQYQHLVFEEFARKVQPEVNVFAGYQTDIDPAIVAEFAHVVYRFGHSMLTETVARTNADGISNDIDLIEAFLNPRAFADDDYNGNAREGAGAVVLGMTSQVGNEIDEFVTGALRSNLLGLPLDLATINMARGRDTGSPTLNQARQQFFDDTAETKLRPYDSWADFKLGITNPLSTVNFIAAYGTHADLQAATTLVDKREVALGLYDGTHLDSAAFLSEDAATSGVNDIDFWVGGMAERTEPFGGMLGSTFNFVFEIEMERLQDGDRFYYLSRTAGLNFLTELENNSFAELIMDNVDGVKHLPGDVFSSPDFSFEIGNVGTSGPILDDPATPYNESALLVRTNNGTVRYAADKHIVMGGTENNDRMEAGAGDDTLWGDGGNDRLEGGSGNDNIIGGDGDDILTDLFGIDNIKGGAGNDAINAGPGTGDLILAGDGNDFVVAGADPKETFGGKGNDFIIGGDSSDIVFGGEGDDWIEGGNQADLLQGDNGDPFQESTIIGNDVIMGGGGNDDYDAESGDDVMFTDAGIERNEGMLGFDWVTAARDTSNGANVGQDYDLFFTGLLPPDLDAIRDRFDLVEAISGWKNNDVLRGDNRDAVDMVGHELNNIGLINGLQELLDEAHDGVAQTFFTGGNIILGGANSDIMEGRGGDDIIDGDKWLNARISVVDINEIEIQTANSMTELQTQIFAGTINPGQLRIVREILDTTPAATDIDTVVFSGNRNEYTLSPNSTTLMTVSHTGGTQVDGTDILMGVERLRFADETIALVPIPGNSPATGTVTINDMTPGENQNLLATKAFSDPDGVVNSTIVYSWEVELTPGVWSPVETGRNFTPNDFSVGSPLRVVATFQDQQGVNEQIMSAVTAPVFNINDNPTGAPMIDDLTPRQNLKLNATPGDLADEDGLVDATFSYQWQVSNGPGWGNIFGNGAKTPTFKPQQVHVGENLRVLISYTDDHGTAETVVSAPTGVVGDFYRGTTGPDIYTGTLGDDKIIGLGGDDVLDGSGGDDIIVQGFGSDIVNGGAGDDTILVFDKSTNAIHGGDGFDQITAMRANGKIGLSELSGIETISAAGVSGVRIFGTGADDILDFSLVTLDNIDSINARGGNDTVTGSSGNDTILGEGGNDTLAGLAGTDTIIGFWGHDILEGGTGDDFLNGGGGRDTFVFAAVGFGHDIIGGTVSERFDAVGNGTLSTQDMIDLSGFGTGLNFGDLTFTSDLNGDTVITVGIDSITVIGVDIALFSADDFIFA